jgi:pyruvate/2-oxoglutarate dehydrogenase complex dihydrolipoamide acyltransferase (E2) component
MPETRVPLVLPELGMQDVPIFIGQWLVEVGREVSEGDRILEIVAGSATVDLPAPASGMLQETFVAEDDRISVGQELGAIMVASGRDE